MIIPSLSLFGSALYTEATKTPRNRTFSNLTIILTSFIKTLGSQLSQKQQFYTLDMLKGKHSRLPELRSAFRKWRRMTDVFIDCGGVECVYEVGLDHKILAIF